MYSMDGAGNSVKTGRTRRASADAECCLRRMIVPGNPEAFVVDLGRVAGWARFGCAIGYERDPVAFRRNLPGGGQ
jgi:hypothetical protein